MDNVENVVSRNVQSIEISGIRKFFNKVAKYPDAISLTLGQPDFNVPAKIKEAMINAIEDNKTTYTSNAGIVELRKEISSYLKTQHINYQQDEICLTIGGSEGLMDVFTALLNPNDKVLIPTPAYPAYESCVKLLGGQILNYNLNKDFSIDFEQLETLIETENPKVMVVSYPSNPTGAIISKEDNDKLHKILKNNEIIIISDEMYSALCFDDNYYSIAQFEDIRNRVIVVGGFSKMFSMTGLRLGYVCADYKLMEAIMKVHQYNVSCAPSIVQWGAYEGLRSCMEDVDYMKSQFIRRRDYLYERLISMGFETNLPMGAFYIFPSIKKFNMESEEFCERLLKEAGVAAVPGSAFGIGGEGYMRISYAYSMEQLKEAADRMESWIKKVGV
ncbi:aminotransferase class I/II-fold pyridoxal phosphate-dependent enzyme [Clostridium sp. CX1]|uniref:pyridoxal phosphate-dependent aminotransferase n=1 Tax=Clostridium sp. CX1 TaxID=2978346 RepID=UPI0021BE99AE|nr:aminotransferase class I/II-fold pyridoxal phosphate-dependent enzyme [Clostridium sp. CX1]MCT8977309.1 aminotransferase class I/II-fold pyridoxal phosphate-dependent enzyme [Clostridium sp. CX1]